MILHNCTALSLDRMQTVMWTIFSKFHREKEGGEIVSEMRAGTAANKRQWIWQETS